LSEGSIIFIDARKEKPALNSHLGKKQILSRERGTGGFQKKEKKKGTSVATTCPEKETPNSLSMAKGKEKNTKRPIARKKKGGGRRCSPASVGGGGRHGSQKHKRKRGVLRDPPGKKGKKGIAFRPTEHHRGPGPRGEVGRKKNQLGVEEKGKKGKKRRT